MWCPSSSRLLRPASTNSESTSHSSRFTSSSRRRNPAVAELRPSPSPPLPNAAHGSAASIVCFTESNSTSLPLPPQLLTQRRGRLQVRTAGGTAVHRRSPLLLCQITSVILKGLRGGPIPTPNWPAPQLFSWLLWTSPTPTHSGTLTCPPLALPRHSVCNSAPGSPPAAPLPPVPRLLPPAAGCMLLFSSSRFSVDRLCCGSGAFFR